MTPFRAIAVPGFLALALLAGLPAAAVDPRFAIDLGLLGGPEVTVQKAEAPSRRHGVSGRRKATHSVRGTRMSSRGRGVKQGGQSGGALALSQRLRAPEVSPISYHLDAVRQVWPTLLGTSPPPQAPVRVSGQNFSLVLDPSRYVMLPALDGGRIVLDPGGEVPPLVRSLVEQASSGVNIVTASPANPRFFYRSLLESAGFYSVVEDFSLEYGTDPRLTVTADFKVERDRESILTNDVVLLNVKDGVEPLPVPLQAFLKSEGYVPVNAGMPGRTVSPRPRQGVVCQMDGNLAPAAIADNFLKALSLPVEKGRSIDLYDRSESGIGLSVRTDRLFTDGGQKFVISTFDGDPVNYTLMRLLETRGYRVIMLEQEDDFRRVMDKLLSRLKIPTSYGMHDLIGGMDRHYGISMSGFLLHDGTQRLVVTDRSIPPLHQTLLGLGGFSIVRP